MAVHITTGRPSGQLLGWDTAAQLRELQDLFCSLLDQVEFAICNLDAGNVSEARSVRADRIDTKTAKIVDAQIKSLTADKLTAGTIDAEEIEVVNLNADNIRTGTLDTQDVTIRGGSSNSYLQISGNRIVMYETGRLRLEAGISEDGVFAFTLYNEQGAPQLYFDSNGNAIFEGNIMGGKLISSVIEGFNNAGQKHGLWANPGAQYADLELWHNGSKYFNISNQIGSAQLSANGSAFLESRGSAGTTIYGNWKSGGQTIATQDYVNQQIQAALNSATKMYNLDKS